jgi:phosphate transport system permease protein
MSTTDSMSGANASPTGRSRDLKSSMLYGGRPISERVIQYVLLGCGMVSIVTTTGIVFVLLFETLNFFQAVSIVQLLFDPEWTPLFPENQHFGIWPLAAGTFLTSAIALATAVPFGLLAAIYLSEFAPAAYGGRLSRFWKFSRACRASCMDISL